jgi:hypothetical protein
MGLVINLKINNAPSGSRPSEPMSPDFTEWLTRNPEPARMTWCNATAR